MPVGVPSPEDLVLGGIGKLLAKDPFFGVLAMHLKPRLARPEEGVPTAAVDAAGHLLFGKEFVEGLGPEDLAFVLGHEALHFGLGHPAAEVDPRWQRAFNIAADAVVNSWLLAAGFRPPAGVRPVTCSTLVEHGLVDPARFGGIADAELHTRFSAGEVLEAILNWAGESLAPPEPSAGGAGDTADAGQGQASSDGRAAPQEGSGGGSGAPGGGKEGKGPREDASSGSAGGRGQAPDGGRGGGHGKGGPSLPDAGPLEGDIRPGPAEPEAGEEGAAAEPGAAAQRAAEAWREAMRQASAMAGHGHIPGWLRDELGLPQPAVVRVPWTRALARVLARERVRTYARPDSYMWAWTRETGILFPGEEDSPVRVGVVVDSSGSVGTEEWRAFRGALHSLAAAGVTVVETVIADAAVQEVHRGLPLNVRLAGRGGTDFRPALDYFLQRRRKAVDVIVYLSDGDGDNYPSSPRGLPPVVWVLTPDGKEQPWGTNIRMSLAAKEGRR